MLISNNKFILPLIISACLYSCGSVNKIIPTANANVKQVYDGDTIYLIKPKVIVRKRFGEGANDFTVDSLENENATSELVYGIKTRANKKLPIIDLLTDGIERQVAYNKMNSLLVNKNDSVYLDFKLSDSLNLVSLSKGANKPIIISYLEWNYGTWDFFQKMKLKYHYWTSGGYHFSETITSMKLNFIVVDPLNGQILTWRFAEFSGNEIKKPTYQNMWFVLPNVMRPFLTSVHKKK